MTHWMRFDGVTRYVMRPSVVAVLFALAFLITLPSLALRIAYPDLISALFLGVLVFSGLRAVKQHPIYPYLTVVFFAAILGHLGFLLGLMMDFGPAGLLMLASWCSSIGGLAPGNIGAMFPASPWSHAGMLLGCNLGMILAGCGRLPLVPRTLPKSLFLFWCNVGMVGGMLLLSILPLTAGQGLTTLAIVMLLQMSCGMALGMVGAWWGLKAHSWILHAEPVFASRLRR